MAERYYLNSPLDAGPITLEGPEAHHLAVVCRIRPGEQVCLFNGDGHEYPALVLSASKKAVELQILAQEIANRELPFRLSVACPLPKGDRGQFLIEKLTELGVTAFFPLKTRHSVTHPSEHKAGKLERYVIEASKQCGRNVLLEIEPVVEWTALVQRDSLPAIRLLADPGGDVFAVEGTKGDTVVAVGPEAGFTSDEIDLALANNWRRIGLGPRILRIETAALAMTALAGVRQPSPNRKLA